MPSKSSADNKQKFDPSIILKDTKNFSDDIEITLPNGAVMTLGDMREYDAATQGSVAKELAKGREELAAERRKVEAASNSVAQMYVELEKQKQQLADLGKGGGGRREEKDELDDVLNADPVYARLSKAQAALQAKIDAMEAKITDGFGKVNNTLNEVGATYLNERYEEDFNRLMSRDDPAKPKDLDLSSLYKYAAENGIKKRNGIIDLNRAYEQYTAPKRLEIEKQTAYEKGKADAIKERDVVNMMPRPTHGMDIPGLDKVVSGAVAPKNLNEAFAAAAKDPSIWSLNNVA